MIGFKQAGSKVSLITASLFAVALAIAGFAGVPQGANLAIGLQVLIIIVFSVRFAKTKKFMPAGMMGLATILAVALELLSRPA